MLIIGSKRRCTANLWPPRYPARNRVSGEVRFLDSGRVHRTPTPEIRVLPALSVAEGSERRELRFLHPGCFYGTKDLSSNLQYLRLLEISLKLIIR